MQVTPQIRFRGMEPSPALEAAVKHRIERLAQFHPRITACNVVIEAPSKRSQQGGIYRVSAHLVVPGADLAVGNGMQDHAHEDAYVAVRDCFDALQRRLEDVVRKKSGYRAKQHPVKLHGAVDRLDPEEGFGFIRDDDGREFFFRRESVTSEKDWQSLAVGTEVHFDENEGEQGPHASAVSVA